jgi:hypothetical protein
VVAPLVRKASGVDGRVTLPEIGALIGYFTHWQLWVPEKAGEYNFQANFGFLVRRLWDLKGADGSEYIKQVVIDFSKDKRYRLEQAPGAKTELDGTRLTMEQVSLVSHEGR